MIHANNEELEELEKSSLHVELDPGQIDLRNVPKFWLMIWLIFVVLKLRLLHSQKKLRV